MHYAARMGQPGVTCITQDMLLEEDASAMRYAAQTLATANVPVPLPDSTAPIFRRDTVQQETDYAASRPVSENCSILAYSQTDLGYILELGGTKIFEAMTQYKKLANLMNKRSFLIL